MVFVVNIDCAFRELETGCFYVLEMNCSFPSILKTLRNDKGQLRKC